eukprot:8384323-Prorocentrum_lima.AAC.1
MFKAFITHKHIHYTADSVEGIFRVEATFRHVKSFCDAVKQEEGDAAEDWPLLDTLAGAQA